MWVGSERRTLCASANEELCTLADNTHLTEPPPPPKKRRVKAAPLKERRHKAACIALWAVLLFFAYIFGVVLLSPSSLCGTAVTTSR